MVQTITPVVHGGRRERWAVSVGLHALGATISAAALGAALGGAGWVLGAPWGRAGLVVVAGAGVLYAARELLGLPVPLPNLHRQVPEWWRTFFTPPAAAFLYGLGLGVGFLTYLSFGTLVAVGAVAFVSGSPLVGLLVVAPFGLARGLSVMVARPAVTTEGVDRVVGRLDALAMSRIPRTVNGVVLLAVAGSAVASAVAASDRGGASSAAAWALAVVFGWAALGKVIRPSEWRAALSAYGLGPVAGPASLLVPLAEGAVVALVVAGWGRGAGVIALGLLAAFTAAAIRAARKLGGRLPCGCFGKTKVRDVRVTVVRNAALAALALFVIAREARGVHFGTPRDADLLPAALAIAGAILVVLLARAARSLLGSSAPRA